MILSEITAAVGRAMQQAQAAVAMPQRVSPPPLVALSAGGSAAGAPGMGLRLMVDDVVFQVVETEELEFSSEVPHHPVEDRQMVSEHAWRNPVKLRISGALIGYPTHTERHKRALEKLVKLWDEARPVTVVCDFPPIRHEDMLITELTVQRRYPWANEYQLNVTLERIVYVTGGQMGAPAGGDPGAPGFALRWEGPPTYGGTQPAGTAATPPASLFGDLLNGVWNTFTSLSQTPLGKLAMDMLKNFVANNLPGGPLLAAALKGDLSAQSLIQAAASLIPGAGPLVSNLMGLAQAAGGLNTLSSLAQTAANLLAGKTDLGTLAQSVVSGLVNAAAQNCPALTGIAGLVSAALRT